jgi:hypothetical protein
MVDGSAPGGHSHRPPSVGATPRTRRNTAPVHHAFSCEVPSDPLRAALGLASMEEPISQPENAQSTENMVAYSLLDFSRRQVASIKPRKSVLSDMVTSRPVPNPFRCMEAQNAETGSLNIDVYFPHAQQPAGQLLVLTLPVNATVEDAITSALWAYWEKRWLPELDASKARDTNIASWIMLVPGKDGVVNRRIAQSSCGFYSLFLPRLTGTYQVKSNTFISTNTLLYAPRGVKPRVSPQLKDDQKYL